MSNSHADNKRIKNIVIACDYAYVEGGAAKVAIQTAIALSKNTDYNIYLLGGCGDPCEDLKQSNVKLVTLSKYDLLTNPSKINAFLAGIYNKDVYDSVYKLLKDLNPSQTIIHVHTWTKVLTSAVFKAADDLNVPIYLTIHDYFLTCPNGGCYNYKTKRICSKIPMSISCVRCNCDSRNYIYKIWRCLRQRKQDKVIKGLKNDVHYIFISRFQKSQIMKRYKLINKASLIQNMISADKRYRVNVENNSMYIYIGRVAAEKGVDLFCEAVARSQVKGVVIGDGAMKETLEKKYPMIYFTGWLSQTEIHEWLSKARGLIFPSLWYEGSPLTIPEVQAYGIPCIVTDCNAGVDTIIHGKNGEIVKAEVNSLTKSIDRFHDDLYVRRLSEETYRLFDESRVKETKYVSELLDVYINRS